MMVFFAFYLYKPVTVSLL